MNLRWLETWYSIIGASYPTIERALFSQASRTNDCSAPILLLFLCTVDDLTLSFCFACLFCFGVLLGHPVFCAFICSPTAWDQLTDHATSSIGTRYKKIPSMTWLRKGSLFHSLDLGGQICLWICLIYSFIVMAFDEECFCFLATLDLSVTCSFSWLKGERPGTRTLAACRCVTMDPYSWLVQKAGHCSLSYPMGQHPLCASSWPSGCRCVAMDWLPRAYCSAGMAHQTGCFPTQAAPRCEGWSNKRPTMRQWGSGMPTASTSSKKLVGIIGLLLFLMFFNTASVDARPIPTQWQTQEEYSSYACGTPLFIQSVQTNPTCLMPCRLPTGPAPTLIELPDYSCSCFSFQLWGLKISSSQIAVVALLPSNWANHLPTVVELQKVVKDVQVTPDTAIILACPDSRVCDGRSRHMQAHPSLGSLWTVDASCVSIFSLIWLEYCWLRMDHIGAGYTRYPFIFRSYRKYMEVYRLWEAKRTLVDNHQADLVRLGFG